MKHKDAFKFNDMVQYSGTEVGSVMGLVSRFEIDMQAGEDIQFHQAGLGGLSNEIIEILTMHYDDITGR
jgi:hypothetical protein